MSDNGYDWMTDARIAGEERREGVRKDRIRYLLSLRFWGVYDGVRYAYGLLDRSDSLPGFDFVDAMDAASEGATYLGVNAGQIKVLTELAEAEGMDRSTPDEWIAFFKGHFLPGAEIFKREGEGESGKSAECVPPDGDRSDFQRHQSEAAKRRHADSYEGKLKLEVCEIWERDPKPHLSSPAFARDLLDRHRDWTISERTLIDWIRALKKSRSTG